MKTRMTRKSRVIALHERGLTNRQIAKRVGATVRQVCCDIWDHYNVKRRRELGRRQYTPVEKYKDYDPAIKPLIIAAVRSGQSYGKVAKQFGLPSRNIVAGLINRAQS